MMLFFPQLDLTGANFASAAVIMAVGSFSFVGIGMMAAVLPLLYVERGAQMTFVIQSVLLLVSGVYYSIAVLPPWMQVLSHLSPATYVLDGVRAALIDGKCHRRPARRPRAAVDHGHRLHPARLCGRSAGPSATRSGPAS